MLPQILSLQPFLSFHYVLEQKKTMKSQISGTRKQLLQGHSLSSEEKGVRQLHQSGEWYMTGECRWLYLVFPFSTYEKVEKTLPTYL